MLNVATWIQPKDEKWFNRVFSNYPEIRLCNASVENVALEEMNGLLLSGGSDIAPEFLNQPVPDPSILDKAIDRIRDRWELKTTRKTLALELPVLAICKGMQLFNVALGGTLRLDITGHNAPEMRDYDVQPLRTTTSAAHRFEKVNSSHHQAVDQLGDGLEVEAWSETDEIIEQIRLREYPFAIGVQYHPERGEIYGALFADFVAHVKGSH
jgi:putative glutamine amidotransferase